MEGPTEQLRGSLPGQRPPPNGHLLRLGAHLLHDQKTWPGTFRSWVIRTKHQASPGAVRVSTNR